MPSIIQITLNICAHKLKYIRGIICAIFHLNHILRTKNSEHIGCQLEETGPHILDHIYYKTSSLEDAWTFDNIEASQGVDDQRKTDVEPCHH